jgi:hypothetical protein
MLTVRWQLLNECKPRHLNQRLHNAELLLKKSGDTRTQHDRAVDQPLFIKEIEAIGSDAL